MKIAKPTVYVVDDDPQVRASLEMMVHSAGLEFAGYGSAEAFLDDFSDAGGAPRCLVVDVRMPGLSGLGLQEQLVASDVNIPIIFVTAYADVALAVQAMKGGADDFLEKPFHRQTLLERVQRAIDRDAEQRWHRSQREDVSARAQSLSSREKEVMELLVAANSAKEIAAALGISVKTVAKHRARVLEKMQVDSVVELTRLTAPIGV